MTRIFQEVSVCGDEGELDDTLCKIYDEDEYVAAKYRQPGYEECSEEQLRLQHLLSCEFEQVKNANYDSLEEEFLECCASGDIDNVEFCISLGVDLDCVDEANMQTGIIKACLNNHVDVMGVLLSHGADYKRFDSFSVTPLLAACNDRGNTPLMYACMNVNVQLVRLFLEEFGLRDVRFVNATNKSGRTALDIARNAKKHSHSKPERRDLTLIKGLLKTAQKRSRRTMMRDDEPIIFSTGAYF